MSDQKIQMRAIREIGKKIDKRFPLLLMEEISGRFDRVGYAIDEKDNIIGLNLKSCNLKKIPQEIRSLKNLQKLDLRFNQISKIKNIETLTSLQKLDLRSNQIFEIKNIEKLINLQKLDLHSNRISKIENIETLTNLKKLDLSSNRIFEIKNIEKLINLQKLDLHSNRIYKIKNIEKLTKLETLNLYSNRISKIENIETLTNLKILFLYSNQIQKIENIKTLTNLKTLNLYSNRISKIENIEKLTNLEELFLYSNQIQNIPSDVINSNDARKILEYAKSIEEEGGEYLNQGKMLVLGHGRVGKTSLVKSLLFASTKDSQYKHDKGEGITVGINIEKYNINLPVKSKEQRKFTLTIWDFGGQEVQHSIHEYFIQKAIVAIVLDMTDSDNKKENQKGTKQKQKNWKNDLEEWIERVRSLTLPKNNDCSKQVFIVLTHLESTEKNFSQKDVEKFLQEKQLGKFKIIPYSSSNTSLLTENKLAEDDIKETEKQKNELKKTITEFVRESSSCNFMISKGKKVVMDKIIEAIEKNKKDGYITMNDFDKICEENKYKEVNSKDILEMFSNNLSDLKYFDKEKLEGRIYETKWIVRYLYRLIGKYIKKKPPQRFSFEDLKRIFKLKEGIKVTEILHIFKALDLIAEEENKQGEKYWIVPDFLEERELEKSEWREEDMVYIGRWDHEWIPSSIFLRLLSKMANNSEFKLNAKSKDWFTIQCKCKNAYALFDRGSITIKVKGNDWGSMLKIVEYAEEYLEAISKQWGLNFNFGVIKDNLNIETKRIYIGGDLIEGDQFNQKAEKIQNQTNKAKTIANPEMSIEKGKTETKKKSWGDKLKIIAAIITVAVLLSGYFGYEKFADFFNPKSESDFKSEIVCDHQRNINCEAVHKNDKALKIKLIINTLKTENEKIQFNAQIIDPSGSSYNDVEEKFILLDDQPAEEVLKDTTKNIFILTFNKKSQASEFGYKFEFENFEPIFFNLNQK